MSPMDAGTQAILKFDDPTAWDEIVRGVPVFRPHSIYQVTHPSGIKYKVKILPGESPPPDSVLLYSVDEERLKQIAATTKEQFDRHGMAGVLYLGHRLQPTVDVATGEIRRPREEDQPIKVGFTGNHRFGHFVNPKGESVPAVLEDWFFEHGHGEAKKQFPHRSVEFNEQKNLLECSSLCKVQPKLPLPVLYAEEQVVHQYIDELPQGTIPDPTSQPDANFGDLSQAEKSLADRIIQYMSQSPMFAAACQKYAAPPPVSITPGPAPAEPIEEETNPMAEQTQNYAEEIDALKSQVAALTTQNQTLAANQAAAALSAKKAQASLKASNLARTYEVDVAELYQEFLDAPEEKHAGIQARVRKNYRVKAQAPVTAEIFNQTGDPNEVIEGTPGMPDGEGMPQTYTDEEINAANDLILNDRTAGKRVSAADPGVWDSYLEKARQMRGKKKAS